MIVVALMSTFAMRQSEKDFDSIANYFELYKSSAILSGMLIEAKHNDGSYIAVSEDDLKASRRILSLNDSAITRSELVAYKVMRNLSEYNHKFTERPNISIYYRSYTGKKLIFAKPDENYDISEATFDPMSCGLARICTLNMHQAELADRVVISDSYKQGSSQIDTFTISSPVYEDGEIIGDVVVDIRVNYSYLNGRSVRTELKNGFYYITIDYDNYPLSSFSGDLVLPIDNNSVIAYQLPFVKVMVDNLWILFASWLLVWTFHKLYLSNIQHRDHLVDAINNAQRDELTELYNRKVFEDDNFNIAIKDGHYSVILIDGTKFKQINDTHGHKVGDLALIHIARMMQSTFRQTDWLIRLGGDEFVVVMPLCPIDTAEKLAASLRENIAMKPLEQYGVDVEVTTGVAKATENDTLIDVIELADQDMYQYKDI